MKIAGVEYPPVKPKGRKGVQAVNYIFTKMQGAGVGSAADVLTMFDDPLFWKHLPVLTGVPENVLESEIEYDALLAGVFEIVKNVASGFESPEVVAALKNSDVTPQGEAQAA
jgi:hypothetical protein